MEGRPIETAIDRIDAALDRLERAMARSAADARDLQSRHANLKATVTEALGELDALIGSSGK